MSATKKEQCPVLGRFTARWIEYLGHYTGPNAEASLALAKTLAAQVPAKCDVVRTMRALVLLRVAAKRDGTPGLRKRAEFDAHLAPFADKARATIAPAFYRAVCGPEVVKAAIRANAAQEFLASINPELLALHCARADRERLRLAIETRDHEYVYSQIPLEAA